MRLKMSRMRACQGQTISKFGGRYLPLCSQYCFSFLPTIATLDAHEGWREEFLAGRDSLYQWLERCKRDVGSNYGRACGKGAGEFARLLQELAEKLSEDVDTPKVPNADFTIAIAT